MTKPARDPVAGGIAALRRLTMEDTSAGDVTRARLLAGDRPGRHRLWLSKRTLLMLVLPLLASSAVAATVIGRAIWNRPSPVSTQESPSARTRPPARPAPATVVEPSGPQPAAPGVSPEQPAATSPSTPGPHAELNAYGAAHRAHFAGRDPVRSLRLWNTYLREFPRGHFVPEATYNRAITLVRLGRRREAITALRPLAAGRFGGYRQTEAQALLESLPQQ